MVLNNGAMKPINFKCPKCGYQLNDIQRDMQFGQVSLLVSTPDQDVKNNQDFFLNDLGIAMRKRRINSKTYGEISIRSRRLVTGTKTELAKIRDGDMKSLLYIFEFLDCYVIAKGSDIRIAIEKNSGHEVMNNDGTTSAYYIPISALPCLVVGKATDK